MNCKFARLNYDSLGQSAVLRFLRRYMVVYRRILGRKSVSTCVYLSSVCHYEINLYARITFYFIRQCFTREEFKLLQTRHYTNSSRRLEKSTLSYIDRLLPEHIGYSFCDENSTVPVEKSSGADIRSDSIIVILIVMASGPHMCCICWCCCCRYFLFNV